MKLFNATKLFSPICFSVDLTLFHQNACLWLYSFIEYLCTNGGKFFDEHGLKSKLQGFLDTLEISCTSLKMHQAWMVYSSKVDYVVGRYLHMTKLWQAILVIPTIIASCNSCEREFFTQNYIKSILSCSLVLETLETKMKVAMAKIPIEAIDFE